MWTFCRYFTFLQFVLKYLRNTLNTLCQNLETKSGKNIQTSVYLWQMLVSWAWECNLDIRSAYAFGGNWDGHMVGIRAVLLFWLPDHLAPSSSSYSLQYCVSLSPAASCSVTPAVHFITWVHYHHYKQLVQASPLNCRCSWEPRNWYWRLSESLT